MISPSTRQELVDAAVDVFTENGLHGARVIDVTTRAGVAAGSFYTYFQTKEELFLEVVTQVRGRMARQVPPPPRRSDFESAETWLHEVVRLQVSHLISCAATWRMINITALGNAAVAAAVRDAPDPLATMLCDEFAMWAQHGWIDPGVEIHTVVAALMALAEQAVQQWPHDGGEVDPADVADPVGEAWVRLLQMSPHGGNR
ncbi:TetR/AcrR family transcriptional regulator [Tomitella fengzijianii]|uniref:TetR/AcrR family transcriptional regulator n=1 Tax=Tomitella fengzijianii TaxID=2597660 RepID=UPI00131AC508|nr:TetR/AcrR family transcriptional regulator [Tomitella fengzijianii]